MRIPLTPCLLPFFFLFFFCSCVDKDLDIGLDELRIDSESVNKCGDETTYSLSGGNVDSREVYSFGEGATQILIARDFYIQKDKMEIYCGPNTDGLLIYSTDGFVDGTDTLIVDLAPCPLNSGFFTLRLEGGGDGTIWDYSIRCQ